MERPWDRKAGPALPFSSRRLADSAESSTVLRMRLIGANASAAVTGAGELPGKSNYFLGNDPHKWRTNVPTYARVKYKDVYQGVDLVYYGSQSGRLEYDFVVAPGANPSAIALAVGAVREPPRAHRDAPLQIAADGDLVIASEGGEVHFRKPLIFQESSDGRREIPGGYVLKGAREVAFKVGAHDTTRPLVIDPVLAYSTYLGGGAYDQGNGIAVDSSGNAYVTGYTESADFPTTAGAFQTSLAGAVNAFVTKLNPTGSALVYSTYLGGSSGSAGYGIAVDSSGHVYVTGVTASSNFPTTAGVFQTSLTGSENAFVTKLNPTGSALAYSTYLGGSTYDWGQGIAVDSVGNAYVSGATQSANFPTTAGAFQTSLAGVQNAIVTELNPGGSALVYSTYLGGSAEDVANCIAVDSSGHAYVTGQTYSGNFPTTAGAFQTSQPGCSGCYNAFVTKLNPSGSALVYSTYLGGDSSEGGPGIAVDSLGSAYVTGWTYSGNFPTTAGAFQTSQPGCSGCYNAFVTKLNPSGSALVYSTYLGGGGNDLGFSMAVDSSGHAYVTGRAGSANFPTTAGAFQTSLAGLTNAFVTKLDPTGSALVYSTYLGGSSYVSGSGIAVDSVGNAYVSGSTQSTNFPTTAGAFQTSLVGSQNAFVAKLGITPQAQIADLENTVKALVSTGTLNPGLGQFLIAPLNAALAALGASPAAAARPTLDTGVAATGLTAVQSGHTAAAIRDLNQFIFEVRLLEILHALTKAEGRILIDAAESIIAALHV